MSKCHLTVIATVKSKVACTYYGINCKQPIQHLVGGLSVPNGSVPSYRHTMLNIKSGV